MKKYKFKYSEELKQLFLSTIAAIIAIVITFGTNAWQKNVESKEARKMLAMTIIHDIDQSLEVIKKRRDAEGKGHAIACYVMENENRLDSIREDTLFMFIEYVTPLSYNNDMLFKTTNENLLNNSQDSWNTLNDRKFLNNVQEFYSTRAVLEKQSREWFCFKKPVNEDEAIALLMEDENRSTADICRIILKNKRLKSYLDYFTTRMSAYYSFLEFTNLNEENKFLMNITEQDMENFVNQTYMEIRPAKEKDIVGTWNAVTADDKNDAVYEFRKDHTFITRQSIRWGSSVFREKIVQHFTMTGTWTIEGDSLIKKYNLKSYKLKVDDSKISYPGHLEDSVRRLKAEMFSESMKPVLVKMLERNNRIAHATNIDKSGTRLELTDNEGRTIHYRKKQRN